MLTVYAALCDLHPDDLAELLKRVAGGFLSYGENNHLSPGYNVDTEQREEVLDAFAQVVFGIRRGEYDVRAPRTSLMLAAQATALKALRE